MYRYTSGNATGKLFAEDEGAKRASFGTRPKNETSFDARFEELARVIERAEDFSVSHDGEAFPRLRRVPWISKQEERRVVDVDVDVVSLDARRSPRRRRRQTRPEKRIRGFH